jgi:hypothetical protein
MDEPVPLSPVESFEPLSDPTKMSRLERAPHATAHAAESMSTSAPKDRVIVGGITSRS